LTNCFAVKCVFNSFFLKSKLDIDLLKIYIYIYILFLCLVRQWIKGKRKVQKEQKDDRYIYHSSLIVNALISSELNMDDNSVIFHHLIVGSMSLFTYSFSGRFMGGDCILKVWR
jgi:hypothetical protein